MLQIPSPQGDLQRGYSVLRGEKINLKRELKNSQVLNNFGAAKECACSLLHTVSGMLPAVVRQRARQIVFLMISSHER